MSCTPLQDALRRHVRRHKYGCYVNTKHVQLSEESWDFGTKAGFCASIIGTDGSALIRQAVAIALCGPTLEPAVWSEPQKVYVMSPSEVPFAELESWQDDDDEPKRMSVSVDEGGFYYIQPPKLLKPAVHGPVDKQKLRDSAIEKLDEWLRLIAQCGELLNAEVEG